MVDNYVSHVIKINLASVSLSSKSHYFKTAKLSADSAQQTSAIVHGWSDVTVICGHITICMLWGNTAYFMKLSGEHFSDYSDKIESVGLRKCPVLLRK